MSASIVSFESFAPAIVSALESADRAATAYASVLSEQINAYIDACYKAGYEKNETDCSWIKYELVNCPAFVDAIAAGLLLEKTVNEYANGAMRAFFHGVPWSASLKNDPAFKLPWVKAKPGRAPKAPKAASANVSSEAPTEPVNLGTATTAEVRAFVEGYAKTLTAYLNKHMAAADLATRDVVQHFAAAVAKLPKLPDDAAPM